MSTSFLSLLPSWAHDPISRAQCLRVARALLALHRSALPVAPLTLRKYESDQVATKDVDIPCLIALAGWYEKHGIVFPTSPDGSAILVRPGTGE
jgi:hypothetical protein